jgi:tartrate-resistant acid phosphatase type 5
MKSIYRRFVGIGLAALAVGLMFSFGGGKEKGALNFFIISDWGWNGFKAQQEVADQMARSAEKIEPSFVVSCGDNFQVQGVASVQDPLWITNYENVYKSVYLQCDWYPVLGNHDYRGNTQAQIDYSKISRRWRLESRYYTMVRRVNDSVSARFIFLDTSPFVTDYYHKPGMPDIPQQDTAAQLAWLREVLANSKEQWKLVFGHHPVFSGGKTHGSTRELIERFRPLFEQYHVQVYFCGHDHDLQHLREKGGSVDYIVTGTGGEPRPTGRIAQTIYSASMPAFSTVSLWGDSIRVRFVDSKGKVEYGMGRSYR